MKRILFLDVDGVLNNHTYLRENGDAFDRDGLAGQMDPANVAALASIVARVPDLEIVLSSTWRLFRVLADFRAALAKRGLPGANLRSSTPDLSRESRAAEINMWLTLAALTATALTAKALTERAVQRLRPDVRVVVVDDDHLGGELLPGCQLVRTSFYTGMLAEHADELTRLLGDSCGT